jgi:hypothetical protein
MVQATPAPEATMHATTEEIDTRPQHERDEESDTTDPNALMDPDKAVSYFDTHYADYYDTDVLAEIRSYIHAWASTYTENDGVLAILRHWENS